MIENTIDLRNINSLSGLHFFIPDYQRGYRWSESEAIQMLKDFKEFCKRISKRKVQSGEFYCLQPVVVKNKTWTQEVDEEQQIIEGYEVIDGQQRLTTLFILLKCLEDMSTFRKFKLYSIHYETRQDFDSQDFLEHIDKPSVNSLEFIDFYYMKKVYDAMKEWIDDLSDSDVQKLLNVLLLEDIDEDIHLDLANNVRMIWYEVADDERASSIDIFTRLNIGKIPLTNAELIKALLLRKGNFCDAETTMKQLQISTEWNQIEQKLQKDSFWYFLYRTNHPFQYNNRIEFIFDLMKGRKKDSEEHFTFLAFYNEVESLLQKKDFFSSRQDVVEYVWLEVKRVFQTFEEWYEDRTLYHLIGFLIEYGEDINIIKKNSLEKNKKDFLDSYITPTIQKMMKGINLHELSYGSKDVKKVLLLFNLLTVLQSEKSDMRFPFNRYKVGKWDIEHITSQTDQVISADKQREAWIDDMFDFFVGSKDISKVVEYIDDLKDQIVKLKKEAKLHKSNELLRKKENELKVLSKVWILYKERKDSHKFDSEKFDSVFNSVQQYCGENLIEDKDAISNLALLDAETNRSYGNAFFPIKRIRITENDRKGIFIPISTKNVFLKYYTHKGDDLMNWSKVDAEDYLAAMESMLKNYMK